MSTPAHQDCDGTVDEDVLLAPEWFPDLDSDGFGDPLGMVIACSAPADYISDHNDCDDARADVYPAADETCDSADQDCDGAVDEDATDTKTWFNDADGDGHGDIYGARFAACSQPTGAVASSTDCDDAAPGVNPSVAETTNGVDDDCDGLIDESLIKGCAVGSSAGGSNGGPAGFALTLGLMGLLRRREQAQR